MTQPLQASSIMEPLEEFFSNYPDFTYDPSAPAVKEFRRLSQTQHWGADQSNAAKSAFKDALMEQFNTSYGDNLDGWHAMLIRMGVDTPPDTIRECKKVAKGLFVNLVDLVDARGDSTRTVQLFGSEEDLSRYTKDTGKFFPKDEAKAGGIIKFLLRHIMWPKK